MNTTTTFGAGRFAPSPTSDLHLGNLRTALVAWLMARVEGRPFLVRVEDLDQIRVAAAPDVAQRQLADLARLGLDWDDDVVWQSNRLDRYEAAAAQLDTYECFCTRREIAEAVSAPHADGHRPYPGTCRDLTEEQRAERRQVRPPALRVRAHGAVETVVDRWAGQVTGEVDDFVIRRNDGAWAYNLAVVVDDVAQGVGQVVRGNDLLSSSPRQAWLTTQLGGTPPDYAHTGLVVNGAHKRLAKRDGAVTLADLRDHGVDAANVLSLLGHSLGLNKVGETVTTTILLARFDPDAFQPTVWMWPGL